MLSNPPSPLSARGLKRPKHGLARWHAFLVLLTGAFVAYAPSVAGDLIWDDTFLVGTNPFFRSPIFCLEVFRHWLFPDSLSVYYRPVQNLSYIADYLLWQGTPFGYHISNIIIHTLAGAVLFLLLERLIARFAPQPDAPPSSRARWLAFGIALVWTVHPMHNAAVAYIAGRADPLAAFFAIGAWLLYLHAGELRSRLCRPLVYAVAWCSGLLALCSKEIAVTWIALFAITELAPGFLFQTPSSARRRISVLTGLILLLAAYLQLRHLPELRHSPPIDGAGFSERMLLMLRALGDYTGLIFWPATLRMCRTVMSSWDYSSAAAWHRAIGYEYLSLLGAGTICAFLAGVRCDKPGAGLRRLGVLWFWIGFLPISNLFPLNAQVAEHWIYMPSIGFLLFLAGCAMALPLGWQRAATVIVAIGAVGLTVRTRLRSEDWTSPERFYQVTLESGAQDPRIMNNVANALAAGGKNAEAEKILRTVLAIRPDYVPARISLGHLLISLGRQAEAARLLQSPAGGDRKYARTWAAPLGLARIQMAQGHMEEALAIIDRALVEYPKTETLENARLELLRKLGRTSEVLAATRQHCREYWWDIAAQASLVRLLIATGQADEALTVIQQAAQLDVWKSDFLILAAKIELSRNRPAAALRYQERAVWRNPAPCQYLFLSTILRELHRDREATAAFLRAAEIQKTVTP